MGSVWQILLGWAVLGSVALTLIGIGFAVMSMTPPDFIIARVCFSAAAIVLTIKTAIWLVKFDAPREDRTIAAFFVLGLIGAVWVWSYTWVYFRQTKGSNTSTQLVTSPPTATEIAEEVAKKLPRQHDEQVQLAPEQLTIKDKVQTEVHRPQKEKAVSSSPTDWLSALKNPPTMSDVFTNDFPNTMKLSDEGEFHWKDINSVTHLKRQLYLDFPANSKFVGFYIPTTDPSDLSRTAEICLNLAHIDAVQHVLGELPKKTFIAAGLGQTTTIQDLTFSGRVVIYHDDFLSITQQADIIRAFAEKHYAVGFFGPSDFGKTLSSWHHLHDAKVVPQ
ncbi:MAG: hypothetical protein ACHP9V_06220 [Terriglobales bacterium]